MYISLVHTKDLIHSPRVRVKENLPSQRQLCPSHRVHDWQGGCLVSSSCHCTPNSEACSPQTHSINQSNWVVINRYLVPNTHISDVVGSGPGDIAHTLAYWMCITHEYIWCLAKCFYTAAGSVPTANKQTIWLSSSRAVMQYINKNMHAHTEQSRVKIRNLSRNSQGSKLIKTHYHSPLWVQLEAHFGHYLELGHLGKDWTGFSLTTTHVTHYPRDWTAYQKEKVVWGILFVCYWRNTFDQVFW